MVPRNYSGLTTKNWLYTRLSEGVLYSNLLLNIGVNVSENSSNFKQKDTLDKTWLKCMACRYDLSCVYWLLVA